MPMENVTTIVLDAKKPESHRRNHKPAGLLYSCCQVFIEAMAGEVVCNTAGHAILNARQGKHDDLVLVVSLAVFGASQA